MEKSDVSERTREKIFRCQQILENAGSEKNVYPQERVIAVIIVLKQLDLTYNPEMDIWAQTYEMLEKEAVLYGYSLRLMVNKLKENDIHETVEACGDEHVKGVILFAAELSHEEIRLFSAIKKPMVLYDQEDPRSEYDCVVADNFEGARRATTCLLQLGFKEVVYFANNESIYNFEERRRGFTQALMEQNLNPYEEGRILPLGSSDGEVRNNLLQYIQYRGIPRAAVMESYQITVGVVQTLQLKSIMIPEQISLISIDEVPAAMTGNQKLTSVRIPHGERAALAVMALDKEIRGTLAAKVVIKVDRPLIPGDTVKNMK